MGTAEEDLTEPSALEECCCGPMFLREFKGLSKQPGLTHQPWLSFLSFPNPLSATKHKMSRVVGLLFLCNFVCKPGPSQLSLQPGLGPVYKKEGYLGMRLARVYKQKFHKGGNPPTRITKAEL